MMQRYVEGEKEGGGEGGERKMERDGTREREKKGGERDTNCEHVLTIRGRDGGEQGGEDT